MGRDRRIVDSAGEEAKVTAALEALKVEMIDSAGVSIEDLETVLKAIEDLLEGTAKVKIWDGTDTLEILDDGTANALTKQGILMYGRRDSANSTICIPVAYNSDADANKGNRVVPVTPMTAELNEGTKIVDASGNILSTMDNIARPGFQKLTDGTNVLNFGTHGAGGGSAFNGLAAFGLRVQGNALRMLPSALYSDSNANKGNTVIPVTPMTRELEEGTRIHTNDACFSVAFGADSVDAKTGYVLIDLSDATNYPHTETNSIHVDWVSICIHGNATAEGQVEIGFVSAIDGDHGTVHMVACLQISKLEAITKIHKNFSPSAIRCTTTSHLAGGTLLKTDDVIFQNDTELAATYGTVIPAVGDLVLLINRVAGTFENVAVSVGYHTI